MVYCQNIVFNLINEAITKEEGPNTDGVRDINKGKFINIEYEHWRRLNQEPASPKKERNKSGRPHAQAVPPGLEEKEVIPKTEVHKSVQKINDSTRDNRTYSIFQTELKKDKQKDVELFNHFSSTNAAKKMMGKTEKKDGSILGDIENNVHTKIQETDNTNSENPSKNSASIQSSPDHFKDKKLDMDLNVPYENI
jgi:hypothetical protein